MKIEAEFSRLQAFDGYRLLLAATDKHGRRVYLSLGLTSEQARDAEEFVRRIERVDG